MTRKISKLPLAVHPHVWVVEEMRMGKGRLWWIPLHAYGTRAFANDEMRYMRAYLKGQGPFRVKKYGRIEK